MTVRLEAATTTLRPDTDDRRKRVSDDLGASKGLSPRILDIRAHAFATAKPACPHPLDAEAGAARINTVESMRLHNNITSGLDAARGRGAPLYRQGQRYTANHSTSFNGSLGWIAARSSERSLRPELPMCRRMANLSSCLTLGAR